MHGKGGGQNDWIPAFAGMTRYVVPAKAGTQQYDRALLKPRITNRFENEGAP